MQLPLGVQNSTPDFSTSAPSWLSVSRVSLQEKGAFALHEVSFTQRQFQKLAIAGETGAGKSTLLQIIAGLIQRSSGEVRFEGDRVKGPTEQLMPGHPGIAYLSQHFELPKFLRVEQVLRYANRFGALDVPTLYEVCRISHLATRQTNQLSGGEKQRIALARLLLTAPKLLLLDEPFSNLDRVHKAVLKAVIQDIGEKLGITCLLISHDPTDTLSWADEIMVLKSGHFIQQGPPTQIYHHPVDEYTAGLFGDYNLLDGPAAKAFAKLSGTKANRQAGKRLLIRPEQLVLSATATDGLPGTVLATRFFGSYSEVDVQVLGTQVLVRTTALHFSVGGPVYVSVAAAGAWVV
jgi:ABC-type sulfate/molybdate transport systems ATPase subunit